jgi:18S rRNA (adenine1779-N6/adenine1780-N6)-dimethyltransferase
LQIRLLFNRKNKTLRACLTTKSVVKLLEENRKTVLSLQQQHPAGKKQLLGESGNDGDQIKAAEQQHQPVQAVLEDILEREKWKGQRAAKLDLDDFLQLLAEFNVAGIHFR